jgi:hypothetical protein
MLQGAYPLGRVDRGHWDRVSGGLPSLELQGDGIPNRSLAVTVTSLKPSGVPIDWPVVATPPRPAKPSVRGAPGQGPPAGSAVGAGTRPAAWAGGTGAPSPARPPVHAVDARAPGPRSWVAVPAEYVPGKARAPRELSPRRRSDPPSGRRELPRETDREGGRRGGRERATPSRETQEGRRGDRSPHRSGDHTRGSGGSGAGRRDGPRDTSRVGWGYTRGAPGGAQGRY